VTRTQEFEKTNEDKVNIKKEKSLKKGRLQL
jgi:hypothetical protein